MGRDITKNERGKVEREGKLQEREKKRKGCTRREGKSRRKKTQRDGKMHGR